MTHDVVPVLAELQARLDRQNGRIAVVERDLARIGPQVAALEVRIEDLRARVDVPRAEHAELADAESLVTQIRREHERMRARVSAASRFEERLGLVEDHIAGTTSST